MGTALNFYTWELACRLPRNHIIVFLSQAPQNMALDNNHVNDVLTTESQYGIMILHHDLKPLHVQL